MKTVKIKDLSKGLTIALCSIGYISDIEDNPSKMRRVETAEEYAYDAPFRFEIGISFLGMTNAQRIFYFGNKESAEIEYNKVIKAINNYKLE